MPNMPIARLRADEMTGTYWTPPREATMAEIHPLLMALLIMLPNYERWRLHSTDVYDMASGGPLGYFDIALDPVTHRACGYFNSVGTNVAMRKPVWFQYASDTCDALQTFYEIVREAGHVD